jgi:hypothetical protein
MPITLKSRCGKHAKPPRAHARRGTPRTADGVLAGLALGLLAGGEWRAREHVTDRCTTDGTGGPRLAALFAGRAVEGKRRAAEREG